MRRRKSSVRRPSISLDKLKPMHQAAPPRQGDDFNILLFGAGAINFGTVEGPWNHSFRIEHRLGPRLKIVGLIDPSIDRAKAAIKAKCDSFVRSAYQDALICASFDDFVKRAQPGQYPQAAILGSPPQFRGTDKPPFNIEAQIIKAFPEIGLFIEKPVSTGPVENALGVAKLLQQKRVVASVGYFLRYLKPVQKIKELIDANGLHVMATTARYSASYEHTNKLAWWDKSKDCGPIVEQATHFADLSRYFGGDVALDTVQAHALEHYEEAGRLSKIPIPEDSIPPEQRIPRVTSAIWKYTTGAVGTLTHSLVLQGAKYDTEIEVIADGWSFRLVDPYGKAELRIRRPGSDAEEIHMEKDDDPFFTEIASFIDAIDPSNPKSIKKAPEVIEESDDEASDEGAATPNEYLADTDILSSYEDACKTYELTWRIREASERSQKMGVIGQQ
ncbi:hypothetical protein E5Q_00526 [Mixia osmundae IAM 14324]|uniref:Gfo/Idh/MocA-like oxidoreductase N-terminal domain-containing protein n=2 Tax=Mixia osmundae (strain CBS 9802 / IAM 14324 / JCM 22182 / KY 12970) TaxID=764103 RepID=G7DTN3_MIXOS|nr:hypothetical protein E5Q_00526 [Mixia osmundae IAM 14324]